MDDYQQFLERKKFQDVQAGFHVELDELINPGADLQLKDFQAALVRWALARGRAAIFADTGLGKTAMQVVWAQMVAAREGRPVLIFAPLAVAKQTQEEAAKFGIKVNYVREMPSPCSDPVVFVTNYDMQQHFAPGYFCGVVLDESSILKNQAGRTRTEMIEKWGTVKYRLSCTATPSPNDFQELGNQAEFLGIMSVSEMLAMFFTLDSTPTSSGQGTSTWILKGHGRVKFWEWLATWAAFVRKPSDLGFSDEGYDLPPLNIIEHEVAIAEAAEGQLFATEARTMGERRAAKRDSLMARVKIAADLVNNSDESWIAWCHLNDEQDALEKAITRDCASVRGADKPQDKEDRLLGFSHGERENMLSKPSIAGFGMNWQHAHNMVFVGLDDSFEKFYQAIRREYRFGQKHPVNVHIVISDKEGAVKSNIERKMAQHEEMAREMVEHMRDIMQRNIIGATIDKTDYHASVGMAAPSWL